MCTMAKLEVIKLSSLQDKWRKIYHKYPFPLRYDCKIPENIIFSRANRLELIIVFACNECKKSRIICLIEKTSMLN